MNPTGIHIRLTTTLNEVIEKALRMHLPTFQTFALTETGHVVRPSKDSIDQYLALRRQHFSNTYLHGSYWINLARDNQRSYKTFLKEIAFAEQLEFTHFVLHPGAAESKNKKDQGILTFAKNLNRSLSQDFPLTILIENTAHGGRSLGSNLADFTILLNELKFPEKIGVCLDTSHAYAYGYDVAEPESFITNLQSCIPLEKIALIHLNDTTEKLGAKIDRHAAPGEGNIGAAALRQLVRHPKLQHVPIIMELPKLDECEEARLVCEVKNW